MKRVEVRIEADLDDVLAMEAERRDTSKGAIIRELIRDLVVGSERAGNDPVADLIGDIDDDAGDTDAVVYATRWPSTATSPRLGS